MSTRTTELILVSVTLTAVAQPLLKFGMSSPGVQQPYGQGDAVGLAVAMATSPSVVGGLLLYAVSAIAWLLGLARADISFAYPFVGLGFVFTLLIGTLLLGEPISWPRVAGTLLVVGGVLLVAAS